MTLPIMAKAGDVVTCEAGHELYRVVKDFVLYGGPLMSENFERIDPTMPEPIKHTRVSGVCRCGALWLRTKAMDGKTGIHFIDGWRPR